jgi:hypothetical protein
MMALESQIQNLVQYGIIDKAMKAMMTMVNLDIAKIKAAYES